MDMVIPLRALSSSHLVESMEELSAVGLGSAHHLAEHFLAPATLSCATWVVTPSPSSSGWREAAICLKVGKTALYDALGRRAVGMLSMSATNPSLTLLQAGCATTVAAMLSVPTIAGS
jgi:hypothetical protein